MKGLEEIDVSVGNENIHVHGEKATVKNMSATGTLNIMLNLPEHMRIKVTESMTNRYGVSLQCFISTYRAHTCKYIGVSQTASQNRTKDTKRNSEKYS